MWCATETKLVRILLKEEPDVLTYTCQNLTTDSLRTAEAGGAHGVHRTWVKRVDTRISHDGQTWRAEVVLR